MKITLTKPHKNTSIDKLVEKLNSLVNGGGGDFFRRDANQNRPNIDFSVHIGSCANNDLHGKLIGLLFLFCSTRETTYMGHGYGKNGSYLFVTQKDFAELMDFLESITPLDSVKIEL